MSSAARLLSREPLTVPKYRLAIITGHPTQWEDPLFRKLAQQDTIDLHVYYASRVGLGREAEAEMGFVIKWDFPVLDGYRYSFIGRSVNSFIRFVSELACRGYDAIVVEGHQELPMQLAIIVGLLARIPLIDRLDSVLVQEPIRKRLLKRLFLPFIFRNMKAFLPLSSLSVEYLRRYGVPQERIFLAPYTVDNEWYAQLCEKWRRQREIIRAEMGIRKDVPVALAVLRFVDRERPLDFLRAAEILQRRNIGMAFILVGDGPQRKEIESFIREARLEQVILPGFRPLSDLPRFYAIADFFVHPAVRECWGLSVNEAMACGLPVIVSDKVGAGYDLVREGNTGLLFPAGDVEALARCIEQLASDSEMCQKMGQNAREVIFNWNYDISVTSIIKAMQHAVAVHRRL